MTDVLVLGHHPHIQWFVIKDRVLLAESLQDRVWIAQPEVRIFQTQKVRQVTHRHFLSDKSGSSGSIASQGQQDEASSSKLSAHSGCIPAFRKGEASSRSHTLHRGNGPVMP